MKRQPTKIVWVFQILAAVILLMTLPGKFMGMEIPIKLFTELGMEPHGRYITATIELIAGIMILIPTSSVLGAVLGAGVMSGAIIGHITKLGFTGDLGQMGFLAIVAFTLCLIVIYLRRHQLPIVNRMFGGGQVS